MAAVGLYDAQIYQDWQRQEIREAVMSFCHEKKILPNWIHQEHTAQYILKASNSEKDLPFFNNKRDGNKVMNILLEKD